MDPWVVNTAVVDPQSHNSLGMPWTDMDGRNVKQFSVFAWAGSVRDENVAFETVAKSTIEIDGGELVLVDPVLYVSVLALFWAAADELSAGGIIVPLLLLMMLAVHSFEVTGRAP